MKISEVEIPAETFADAKKWLSARTPLLRSGGGVDEFEGPSSWDSRSLYFSGPDGAILELIARRRLPHLAADSLRLMNISEVGVASDSVSEAARQLERQFGAPSFGPRFDDFNPVGDEAGLFILVATGRPWAPEQRQRSGGLPLRIRLDADVPEPRSVQLGDTCVVTSG